MALDCDRTFTANEGEINFDPTLFKFRTDDTVHCDYRIFLPVGNRIRLSIHNMSASCELTTLSVKNGPSLDSPGFPGLYSDSVICNEHPIRELVSQVAP